MSGGLPGERTGPRWGAEVVGAGEVRFRTWAPGAESLALRIDGRDLPMARDDDGWFELVATGISPGAAYTYALPDGTVVPDPASCAQAADVHGPSLVVDPAGYAWQDAGWTGRPWEEAVIYELHVGTFTPEGTFEAARERLGHLADLGVTAIELMPVAQFSGQRGWGYDGVLLYAPHSAYGTPDDMKAFVDAAHAHSLMVLLDVVYNHFGPDGNYLPTLAPAFFDSARHTPWGAAIAYDRPAVRAFVRDNVRYWLEEFHLDGLRFDAIDQVRDPLSDPEILLEVAGHVRRDFPGRHIHLTTEDNRNVTHLHERDAEGGVTHFTAEWNDDVHNAAHVVATGEIDGYYEDFAEQPARHLARALAEGFAYQGEPSAHSDGEFRGAPSGHLPPTAFVDFLQNHDQVGNRALGERLSVLASVEVRRVLKAMLLLSPHIPLLFMGEEWDETRPFLFFTDFDGDLADAVREGRRREFARFGAFDSTEKRRQIPDPNSVETFTQCKLDWARAEGEGAEALAFTRHLLDLRRKHVVPLLAGAGSHSGQVVGSDADVVAVDWALGGARLQLRANLGSEEASAPGCSGEVIFSCPASCEDALQHGRLASLSIVVARAAEESV